MPLFKQYHVNLVFNGHTHIYYQTIMDGVHYFTTGGAGDPYYLVKVDGKSMVVKGISNGNTLDVLNLNLP